MNEKIKGFKNWILILLAVYALINLVHFAWVYSEPEGYWSFYYFVKLFGILLFGAFVVGLVCFLLLGYIWSFFVQFPRSLPKNITFSGLLKGLGMALFLTLVISFNILQAELPDLLFSKGMADKYSYINKSDELIEQGYYQKALVSSKNIYLDAKQRSNSIPFFLLSYWYQHSNYYLIRNAAKLYAAMINLSYCQMQDVRSVHLNEQLFKEALQLSRGKFLGSNYEYQIYPKVGLACLYLNQGKYPLAEQYFNEVNAQWSSIAKEDVMIVIAANIFFSTYARNIGDASRVLDLERTNLELYERSELSRSSKFYLQLLLSTATAELGNGGFAKAEALLIKARPIAKKKSDKAVYMDYLKLKTDFCFRAAILDQAGPEILDEGLWHKVVCLFTRELPLKQRLFNEAESSLVELIDHGTKKGDGYSVDNLYNQEFLAVIYLSKGDNAKAKLLLEDGLKKIAGNGQYKGELYYSMTLKAILASNELGSKQVAEQLEAIEAYYLKLLEERYLFFTEDEREKYAEKLDFTFQTLNAIYAKQNTSASIQKIANNSLVLKNLALYTNQFLKEYLRGQQQLSLQKYKAFQQENDQLCLNLSNMSSTQFRKASEALRTKERVIAAEFAEHAKSSALHRISTDWKSVQKTLNQDEVMIDFISIPLQPLQSKALGYYALAYHKNSSVPALVQIGTDQGIKDVLNQPGNTEKRIKSIYLDHRADLYNAVWKPLAQAIGPSKKVLISASGILHTISFKGLLAECDLQISMLSSPTELLSKTTIYNSGKMASLFGDINYDVSEHQAEAVNSSFSKSNSQKIKFKRLKYTKLEVNDIAGILRSNSGKLDLRTDSSATEASFRALSGRENGIIHIATHASFTTLNQTFKFTSGGYFDMGAFDLLSKCELLLAGVNSSFGRNAANDGVLSAREVSKLDLSKTDLVVLSACETGLGEIRGGEGVFGFQRGFKLAGVKSLIVSLWTVPDQQTSELMKKFYYYYSNGFGKSESLNKAQLDLKEIYANPFYWAGFILIDG